MVCIELPTAPRARIGFLGYLREKYGKLAKHREKRRNLKIARQAFMNTVHLDDKMLDDMGVTREEVLWALRLPLELNAARELHARAKRRRRQEKPSLR